MAGRVCERATACCGGAALILPPRPQRAQRDQPNRAPTLASSPSTLRGPGDQLAPLPSSPLKPPPNVHTSPAAVTAALRKRPAESCSGRRGAAASGHTGGGHAGQHAAAAKWEQQRRRQRRQQRQAAQASKPAPSLCARLHDALSVEPRQLGQQRRVDALAGAAQAHGHRDLTGHQARDGYVCAGGGSRRVERRQGRRVG